VIALSLLVLSLVAASDSLLTRAVPPTTRPSSLSRTAHAARRALPPAHRSRLADTLIVLPEVLVERERALSDARRLLPTAFVTDLSTRASDRAVQSLADVLSEAAGVHVEQYGGLGSFSTVSLRGAAPGQVTIFLDGVPLTSAAHGVVSLGDLPANAIERVEVFRGLGPLGLGVATPGGAVNLVTVSSPDVRELHVSRGSFSTWEGRGTAGLERGPVGLLVHAGYQRSAGDFRFLSDNGTPLNLADDRVESRLNDHFDAWNALGSLTWRPRRGWRVLAREDVFDKVQGLPGRGTVQALATRLSFLRALSLVEASREGTRLAPRVTLRLSADRERSRFRDLFLPDRGELGQVRHDSDDPSAADAATLSLAWARPAEWLALEVAGSLGRERADSRDAADSLPDPPTSRRFSRGAVASLQLRTPDGRLVLHAAQRWDRIEDHLNDVAAESLVVHTDVTRALASPQLGARLGLLAGLELRANWTRASRAPEFIELFGGRGSVTGNPSLLPETAENWDAGAAWRGRIQGAPAWLEWAHFHSEARDLVVYVENSATTVRARNFNRARIRGDEWSAHLEPAPRLILTAAWMWQSAINEGPLPVFWVGKRLPGRPSRQIFARLDWRAGGRLGLRTSADLEVIGDNVLDPYNLDRVPERRLVGASLSVAPFGEALRFTLEGKNLGDDRAEDVDGFPLPGRSVFLACGWRAEPTRTSGQEP
jgi:iron complex outermembrane receptor protein